MCLTCVLCLTCGFQDSLAYHLESFRYLFQSEKHEGLPIWKERVKSEGPTSQSFEEHPSSFFTTGAFSTNLSKIFFSVPCFLLACSIPPPHLAFVPPGAPDPVLKAQWGLEWGVEWCQCRKACGCWKFQQNIAWDRQLTLKYHLLFI